MRKSAPLVRVAGGRSKRPSFEQVRSASILGSVLGDKPGTLPIGQEWPQCGQAGCGPGSRGASQCSPLCVCSGREEESFGSPRFPLFSPPSSEPGWRWELPPCWPGGFHALEELGHIGVHFPVVLHPLLAEPGRSLPVLGIPHSRSREGAVTRLRVDARILAHVAFILCWHVLVPLKFLDCSPRYSTCPSLLEHQLLPIQKEQGHLSVIYRTG